VKSTARREYVALSNDFLQIIWTSRMRQRQ